MRILIVGAGTHREFGFRRLRELGHTIGVIDDLSFIPVELVDWFHPVAARDAVEACEIVERSGQTFDAVMCFSEWHLQSAVEAAQSLGIPGPRLDVVTARQKDAMRAAFRAHDMRVPESRTMTRETDLAALDGLTFPLVVKPVDYSSSSGVSLVPDAGDLSAAIDVAISKSFRGVALVEEYLPGAEYSVEGVVAQGVVAVLGVTQKHTTRPPYFVEVGHFFPADLVREVQEAVVGEATRAVAAVNLDACAFHCEVKFWEGRATVIEIAGRIAGGHIPRLMHEAFGVDIYAAELAAILGQDVAPHSRRTRDLAAAVRFLEAPEGRNIRWPSTQTVIGTELSETLVDLKHLYPWYVSAPRLDGAGRRLGYCIMAGRRSEVMSAYEQAARLAPIGD